MCGHGPDEAALGVSMRIAWRTLVLAGVGDDEVLPMLERLLLVERIEDLFVTVCDLTVAPDRRSVKLPARRTSHSPAHRRVRSRELPDDRRGVPLGVIPDAQWATHVQPLGPSWTLLMFTDGLFEVRRGNGSERLGVDGLITMLSGLLSVTDDDLEPLDRLLVAGRVVARRPARRRRRHAGAPVAP